MIEHSQDLTELSKALVAAQKEMRGATKDSNNPHFKNRYASLEAVIDVAKPALTANGLAFTQAPGSLVDGAIEITTMLLHSSGQWLRSTLHMPIAKRDPQGVGSAITYALRYSLMAVLGVPPTDDDDAEKATDRSPPQRQQAKAPPQPAALTEFEKRMRDTLQRQVADASTYKEISAVVKDKAFTEGLDKLPQKIGDEIWAKAQKKKGELRDNLAQATGKPVQEPADQ